MESSPVRNRLFLVAAALLFSTGGAAIKAATLNGWQVASFRSLVAVVAILLAAPEARRGWSWRTLPVGASYAAVLVLFVLANRLTTSANAIFLQSTAPLYVLLLAPWLLHEPVRARDLALGAAVLGGMLLCFAGTGQPLTTAPDPARGNLLGFGSGVAWALTVTGLRGLGKSSKGNRALATVAVGNLIAAAAALPMALPLPAISLANAAVIVYLGIFQIGLAYVFVAHAIRHVPAFEATAILLVEPVVNPVWSWAIHGEKPAPLALAGGVVILSATLWNTWRGPRPAEEKSASM